jgi:hypothetical protein
MEIMEWRKEEVKSEIRISKSEKFQVGFKVQVLLIPTNPKSEYRNPKGYHVNVRIPRFDQPF